MPRWKKGFSPPSVLPQEPNTKSNGVKQTFTQLTSQLEVLKKHNRELEQKLKERDNEVEKLKEDLDKSNKALERAHQKLEQQLIQLRRDNENKKPKDALVGARKPTESETIPRRRLAIKPEPQKIRHSVKKTQKTPEQRRFLKKAILINDYLKHLSEDQINEIIDWMQQTTPSNNTFIKEGTIGDRLFILEDGELLVTQESRLINIIKPPSVFGELALLHDCRRTATVRAKSPTKVWMLQRNMFRNIMKTTTKTKRVELIQALGKVPLMQTLGISKLGKLTEVLEEEMFEKGQYIVRQGETGEIFYIIMEGEVDVTEIGQEKHEESFIRTLGKGSYFGEKALRSENGKREANVIAKNKVRCMTLDKKPFHSLIGNMADKDWESSERRPTLSRANRVSIFKDYTLRDFDFVGVLGIGGFGRVELICLKEDPNRSFALKCMKKIHIVETNQEEHIYSEKQIMLNSNSPFIVQLYKTFKNDRYVYMLMEPCLGGELWAKLRDDGYFDEGKARFYTACVVEAIEYLHFHGVIYRDIKPENLLLDEKGFVKIVDFGFSKKISHGEKTWTFCGTPEYVAPEIVLNKGHDVAVDYWALGILIFEILTGNPPFSSADPMDTYRQILRGVDSVEWPHRISAPAKNLIRRLCRENPAERIGNLRGGTSDIKEHRWFSVPGFDWISLKNGTYNSPYVPKITSPTDLSNFDRFEREEEMVEKETSGWDKDF